ncbi:MAG: glycosyltransferase family 4 protein, partial [Chloroflexi bacterium]|nr:glycosyltransferase family 4 protein [Chloroflexota bacterium]
VRALPLGKALAARGHQVMMILPPWDHPRDAGKEWVEDGVHICNVRLPAHIPLWQHIVLTWRLVRAALLHDPDIIHCFKPKSYAGLVAWIVWQLKRMGQTRARLVVDTDDWEGPGGWNELGRYSWAQKRFFARQERWGLTHCDAVTVASRALETIVWSLGVPVTKVHYLPNGWWPEEHTVAEHEIAALRQQYGLGDAPVALLYTRFFEYHIERVLTIIQGVLADVPETRWLVVGKGLFGEEEQLLTMAREHGLAPHITYAGWVPPQQLPAHFALAQVAIYPFDDTLINRTKCAVKLIDLLAAGVPVVADNVGQNAEYIVHGVSGLLVSPGDTERFVDAVVQLLRDPALASRLGRAARTHIQSAFSWHKLAERAEKAYQSQN